VVRQIIKLSNFAVLNVVQREICKAELASNGIGGVGLEHLVHFRDRGPSFSKVGGRPAESVGIGHSLEDAASNHFLWRKN
jgi:hypothetical protein